MNSTKNFAKQVLNSTLGIGKTLKLNKNNMINTILKSLVDSFCCIMIVTFTPVGLAILIAPLFTADPLWSSLFAVPFLCVGILFFAVLDRRG
jgi:ABC-type tungstate transport system substrate-binding protein